MIRDDLSYCSVASLTERRPENASGRYYVDSTCIDCDQCRVSAPQFFSHHADRGSSVVCRQPETQYEIALVEEALNACAVGSIGNDGA